jgi:Fuc2NAc and GlcNAc transferase
VGGGSLVSAIGWLDDHKSLPPLPRVLTHIVAGAWFVGWAFGVPGDLFLWLPRGAAAIAIAWCVNFYNFMDGIDGLAATEAVFACGAAGLMLLTAGATPLAWISLLIAVSAAAFVPWNWPPAKVFMGDVGSGMIGYMIASLALLSAHAGALPLPVWLILISVFWFDATTTLFRRVLRGERWYAAHRLHAYQRLVQSGWSHARTTLAVLAANVVVAPFALLAWRLPGWGWPAVVLACAVLAVAYAAVERARPMWLGVGMLSGPAETIGPSSGFHGAPVTLPTSRPAGSSAAPNPSARHTVAKTSL